MHSAMFRPLSPMVWCIWPPMLTKTLLLLRESIFIQRKPLTQVVDRERKEYAVFRELLRMIPGLEARLMESSEEQVVNVADLVT